MLAILDQTAPLCVKEALARIGYRVLTLPPHPSLPVPVSSHPDMLLFFSEDAVLCSESYKQIALPELEEISKITQKPIRTVGSDYGARYPEDILFNAAEVGRHIFCHPRATAKEILSLPNRTPVFVKQGYAKCSVVPVGKHALITSDSSIARAATACGTDVLIVDDTAVALPGYDHGFIGGCTSYSPYQTVDEILFCGDLTALPDHEKMQAFCRRYGMHLRSLGNILPRDVGTVFLI